jgi:curved DNA-binding protein CbpA
MATKGSASVRLAAMKRNCRSYYDLLGVAATAHLDDIKKAFRAKVLLLHPDKNQDAPEEAAELFSLVQVAYNTLSQVELRDKYDASLRASGDERLTPLMLEGNELWQAFEVMDKFKSEGFAVLSA